jgi:hypothetical protein
MPATFALSEAIVTVVRDVMTAREGTLSCGYPSLVVSWTSRTATLYRVRVDQCETNDVVVKVLNDACQAAALFRSMEQLAEVLSQDRSGGFLPMAPLGFSDAIGGVIMPYVKGPSLAQVLQGHSAGPPNSHNAIVGLVARCGRLLARYHARFSEESHCGIDEAWRDLVNGVFGTTTHTQDVVQPSVTSRTFVDFQPSHIIIASDGRLTVIDPPIERHYRFVAQDIAQFIDKMLMSAHGLRALLAAPFRVYSHHELSAAFIRGYDEECVGTLTRGDRRAIDVYLAYLFKRRLDMCLSKRKTGRFLYNGVRFFYQYRRVMKKLRAPIQTRRPQVRVPASRS